MSYKNYQNNNDNIQNCPTELGFVQQKLAVCWTAVKQMKKDFTKTGTYNLKEKLLIKNESRAFSDLFGKFLVPNEIGKKLCDFGKKYTILGKNSVIFSKIGKVYLLNLDFLLIGNVSDQLGIFSANWEKNCYWKPDPVLYREKALESIGKQRIKLCPISRLKAIINVGNFENKFHFVRLQS